MESDPLLHGYYKQCLNAGNILVWPFARTVCLSVVKYLGMQLLSYMFNFGKNHHIVFQSDFTKRPSLQHHLWLSHRWLVHSAAKGYLVCFQRL